MVLPHDRCDACNDEEEMDRADPTAEECERWDLIPPNTDVSTAPADARNAASVSSAAAKLADSAARNLFNCVRGESVTLEVRSDGRTPSDRREAGDDPDAVGEIWCLNGLAAAAAAGQRGCCHGGI